MLGYCALVCLLLLAVLGMAVYTSLIHLWPYNLGFTLKHYHYALVGGDYAPAFWNSLKMGAWTALIGTVFVFCTAYLLEKTRGLEPLRPALRLLALLSMAVPGLVLGLGYIMFFNHPQNPINFLYQTMAILAISTVVHYYTSGHLTAVTALKALDDEYEAVSASLKVPFYKTFWRVTVPVCLPAILEIARYYFVVSISTLSCVVFLYAPHTILAAVAIMNMDEAGDIGPACRARHPDRARLGRRCACSTRSPPACCSPNPRPGASTWRKHERARSSSLPARSPPRPRTKLAMVRDWGSRDTGFIAINRRVREHAAGSGRPEGDARLRAAPGQRHLRGRGDARHPGAERRPRAGAAERRLLQAHRSASAGFSAARTTAIEYPKSASP